MWTDWRVVTVPLQLSPCAETLSMHLSVSAPECRGWFSPILRAHCGTRSQTKLCLLRGHFSHLLLSFR